MSRAHDDYFLTEVMTATPQKLQLMLVEGALRYGNLARGHWRAGDNGAAGDALIRCQQIVAEMVSGLSMRDNPELAKKIAAVYLFVHRALVAANLERSEAKLDEALRILEIERETWRMACNRPSGAPAPHTDLSDIAIETGRSFIA